MTTKTLIISSIAAALFAGSTAVASFARTAPLQGSPTPSEARGTSCNSTRTRLAAKASSLSVVRSRGDDPELPPAYGWPVKPFDRQHPLRGFLNDPRIGAHGSEAFHFGVDVAAPDGTAVYAVAGGEIFFDSAQAIAVKSGPNHEFGYWHIVPVVKSHQIVHTHDLLGHIAPGWGHVHFAERIDGIYVNPIRPGGLGPYTDPLPPTVSGIDFVAHSDGGFDVVTNAFDTTWPTVEGPWAHEPVTPALVEWRIVRGGNAPGGWHPAADFRNHMLDQSEFGEIYAPETTQNHKGVPGTYCFYLARGWKPADATYRIDVAAFDTRGNNAVGHLDVEVTDGKIRQAAPAL